MTPSDHCDGFGHCTGGVGSLCWSFHLRPATPIDETQATEQFVGANRGGVDCLLGQSDGIVGFQMICFRIGDCMDLKLTIVFLDTSQHTMGKTIV